MTKKPPTKWELRFSDRARKNLKSLDKRKAKIIVESLHQKLETEENPRRFGKPFSGNLKNFWRYRVEDYRIICEIKDHEFQIMAVKVAHRRHVYKHLDLLSFSS